MRPTQEYNQTYIVDPKRTFVIEPKGGEINYSVAYKDPLKFYDNVMKQEIVEHKISQKHLGTRQPMVYKKINTKRAIALFFEVIDRQLSALMKQKTKTVF